MLLHFLKTAWRMLLRYRAQSAISIAGLSVGLLCFGLCMYVVRYINSFDTNFPNHNRIYEVVLKCLDESDDFMAGTPGFLISELKQQNFSEVELYTTTSYADRRHVSVEQANGLAIPYEIRYMEIDSCFTDIFSVPFVYGNRQTAFAQPNAIILTRSMAQKMFGDKNPVGEKIRGYVPEYMTNEGEGEVNLIYTITAVVEDLPLNNTFSPQKQIDLFYYQDERGILTNRSRQRSMTGCTTYALCYPHTDVKTVNKKIEDSDYSIEMFSRQNRPIFTPMGELYITNQAYGILSYILMLIGTLILLVALLNFYVFTVGQFFNRLKEMGIRKSLGSVWYHQFGLLFTEQFIMLLTVLLIVLCLTEWIFPDNVFSLGILHFPIMQSQIIAQLVQYVLLLMVLSACICLYVVWKSSRMTMQKAIKGGNKHWVRNGILTLQLFISILFIGGSAILQMHSKKITNEVYSSLTLSEKEQIVKIHLDHPYMKPFRPLIIDELKKSAVVKDILITNYDLVSSLQSYIYLSADIEHRQGVNIILTSAGMNYASFFKIPLIRGREPMSDHEVLVNSMLLQKADTLGLGSTLYRYNGEGNTIVGEIGNVVKSGHSMDTPYILVDVSPADQINYLYVKAQEGQTAQMKEAIARTVSQFVPEGYQVETETLRSEIDSVFSIEKSIGQLITLLALVSLIITLLGVYSAITLDTERRQKEVSIRKINGAGQGRLIMLFGRFYLIILGVALFFALPIVYIVNKQMLQNYVVSVSVDVWFLLALIIFITLFVGLTVIFRILRIVRLNPAEVIKSE